MDDYIVHASPDPADGYQILIVNRNANTWHLFCEFRKFEFDNAQYTCDLLNKEAARVRELRENG